MICCKYFKISSYAKTERYFFLRNFCKSLNQMYGLIKCIPGDVVNDKTDLWEEPESIFIEQLQMIQQKRIPNYHNTDGKAGQQKVNLINGWQYIYIYMILFLIWSNFHSVCLIPPPTSIIRICWNWFWMISIKITDTRGNPRNYLHLYRRIYQAKIVSIDWEE